jgi:hypothetical protein
VLLRILAAPWMVLSAPNCAGLCAAVLASNFFVRIVLHDLSPFLNYSYFNDWGGKMAAADLERRERDLFGRAPAVVTPCFLARARRASTINDDGRFLPVFPAFISLTVDWLHPSSSLMAR